MSVDKKYFKKIEIPKDNNCLFRSIVVFLNNQLLECRRNKQAHPCNKILDEYENSCALFLRKSVVRMIKSRKSKYSKKEFYDDKLYSSIEDRISKMSKSVRYFTRFKVKN